MLTEHARDAHSRGAFATLTISTSRPCGLVSWLMGYFLLFCKDFNQIQYPTRSGFPFLKRTPSIALVIAVGETIFSSCLTTARIFNL